MSVSCTPAVRRVHIVGGAGSGKTTLACQLSGGLHAPVYHLDAVNFIAHTGHTRPYADRVADIQRIAAELAWISEGIYLGWTDALLEAADRIIWLDLSWPIALYRIVLRYIQASSRDTNTYPGLGRLLRFVRWSAAYYRPMSPAQIDALDEERPHTRAATARHLRPYQSKVTRCCTPADVTRLLAALRAAGLLLETRPTE